MFHCCLYLQHCVVFFQCCAGLDNAVMPMKDQKNLVEDIANEAVNLLWNLW